MDPGDLAMFVQKIAWRCRLISAPLRALPGFLIIGAMKSGTSSLFHYLAQHPQLIPAKKKEVHFFDRAGSARPQEREVSVNWYRSHFPLRTTMRRNSMTYEATPKYICYPSAAKQISEINADMKLILMLRDPAERAISHYFHSKRNRGDPTSLHATMTREVERLSPGPESKAVNADNLDYTSYVGRGLYRQQIDTYLSHFHRRRMFIINSEEFFLNPRLSFPRLFQFLGIRADVNIEDLTARNVSLRKREVWPRTRMLLREFYKPHNEELFALLGSRYDWNDAG